MSTQKTVRQQFGTVEESEALRVDQERAEQIIEALNRDLADSYVLYHQLKKHHWNVEGAEFLDLHVYIDEAIEDTEEFADELAERAQALGGVPISRMDNLHEAATVEPEDEDVYDIRTSLRHDMEMMGDIIETLREHVELFENLGDYATAEIVRENLPHIEEHAHHFEHYLEDDTLVVQD